MECVILCGGKGMRMGGLTEEIPKPLLMIGDKPIIQYIIEYYASYGVKKFILCLGYLGNMIKEYFEKNPLKYEILFINTGENSTKSQRLIKVKNLIADENFFVSYGDDLCNVNIKRLVEYHEKEGRIATLTAVKLPNPYGVLEFDEFEPLIITGFKEKPFMKDWVNGGYFLFNKKIFEYIQDDDDLEKEVFEKLVKERQMSAFRHPGFWKSMNTMKDYIELNEFFKKGELLEKLKNE